MGRPPGTGIKQTQRSSPGKAKKPAPKKNQMFYCFRCGREYTKQLGNFSKTRSPMWAQNEGFIPVCNQCTKELYEHYFETFNSKEAALRRLCMKFDVFWSDKVYKMTLGGAVRDNPFKEYVSKSNLQQVRGTSYDDTLDNEAIENGDYVLNDADVKEAAESGDVNISTDNVEKWGSGYSNEEYMMMNHHYKGLAQGDKHIDFLKDKYLRDMCKTQVQASRALAKNDVKSYSELQTLYQKTAAIAQIKIAADVDTSNDSFGKWLASIEEYTPAEYYSDKSKYRDFFGIGEYCERFIFRPLKNWITGSKEKDKEFNLDGEES